MHKEVHKSICHFKGAVWDSSVCTLVLTFTTLSSRIYVATALWRSDFPDWFCVQTVLHDPVWRGVGARFSSCSTSNNIHCSVRTIWQCVTAQSNWNPHHCRQRKASRTVQDIGYIYLKVQGTQNDEEQMVSLNIKHHSVCVNTDGKIQFHTHSASTCWTTELDQLN